MVPGTADGSFEGQYLRCGSRIAGQAVPGVLGRLALAAPVLPIRPVHLHHPDPGCGYVPGQPGAVAAGPLDPGQ
jgi:hypothetical protein